MRSAIAVVVASILFLFIAYLAVSGYVIMSDFWTGLSLVLIPIALGILYWGFKPQIHGLFRKKVKPETEIKTEPKNEPVKIETKVNEKQKKLKGALLLDNTEITKLNIDEEFLDRFYEKSKKQAIEIYEDAKLTSFSIQVIPFEIMGSSVNLYTGFYSKWANKICRFQYSDINQKLRHCKPDKIPTNFDSPVAIKTLPWKKSPNWMDFIRRAYDKIKPLPRVEGTAYSLFYSVPHNWRLIFEDGLNGNEYKFSWDGKRLSEKSIKQTC